ncbi:hypothetical protein [Haloferax sp. DFSO52]|uniref:hypothetical protein n=1 Tax=Haloferax sp. DFSO52 TaxID=3388505 RepID=UPI003A863047
MRKDLFELLYDLRPTKILLKLYLTGKEFVRGNVRSKIEDKIIVDPEMLLNIRDSGSLPHAEFTIMIDNRNFSPLRIDGINVVLSLGREDSYFKNIFWSRKGVSSPPPNITLSEIGGNEEGQLEILTMLPSYLYFPNRDITIFLSGTLKIRTDAGHVEHEISTKARLKREDLWNRSTAQEDLMRNFTPFELDEELR